MNEKEKKLIYGFLKEFANDVHEKMTQITSGQPEDQLRSPFENFMSNAASVLGWKVVCTGEVQLTINLGRPDYAIHRNNLLAGYAELKAPGEGVDKDHFNGHNLEQFNRFSSIPNILYTGRQQLGALP